jgi:carbon storage regulator
MLVLSRLRDETIMIGDDIEVTVVDIRGDKVRLGINAPTRIAVHRKEVYEAIKRENQQAARVEHGAVGGLTIAARAVGVRPGGASGSRLAASTVRPVERDSARDGFPRTGTAAPVP